ncbi:MAG: large subunit ribosomal protein L6 [Chlamydiales bacterium]|jgi:large subunit ribosomal protein L6
MSRIGKEPIVLPKGSEAKLVGKLLTVKGPKGSLELELMDCVDVTIEAEVLTVNLIGDDSDNSKFHGLHRALINNMVAGTTNGFEKVLEMQGVGYRAAVKGRQLDVQVGFSHPTLMDIPDGIEIKVEKNTVLTLTGIDKQKVGQFAAEIRAKRPPEPYKGKGIRYRGEYVRRKAGKTAKS